MINRKYEPYTDTRINALARLWHDGEIYSDRDIDDDKKPGILSWVFPVSPGKPVLDYADELFEGTGEELGLIYNFCCEASGLMVDGCLTFLGAYFLSKNDLERVITVATRISELRSRHDDELDALAPIGGG